MILIALLVILVILIYIKVVKPYDYWTNRGVKQRKPFYILGDNASVFLKKESFFELMLNLYKTFPEERYMGFYQLTLPTLLIRDLELIKQIAVKDFDHFVDHRQLISEGVDPIWTKNLFALRGDRWRKMRATLSPSFTSSKMKIIFNLIWECADGYSEHFKKTNETKIIELKDTFTRYTNDVIATAAFGIKCDSINEKTNEFYLMGKEVSTFTFSKNLVFFAYAVVPKLAKVLGMKLFPRRLTDFFENIMVNTIKTREEQGIVRPDMIHLLLEARKGKQTAEEHPTIETGFATAQETIKADISKKFEITDVDIAAQAMIFFLAGFDTVSTVMSFMGHELALNPDVQKKLQEEIDETIRDCKGKLTYEALMKMKYMDMVVSETLRKWPPAIGSERVCTKSFTIEPVNTNEREVRLEPGDIVWIPTNAIQRDPKYYPNPDKFDPERFSDENRNYIIPYTYMPFGVGPRNCIGSRFALLEIKTIYFNLLRNFELVVVEKTDISVKIKKNFFGLQPEKGMWIGLKQRNL